MGLTLLDLPSELLLSVARQVEDERDLNTLVRTCRYLYHTLNRELYRQNIRWSGSSALLWAAQHGRVTTIQMALAEGADIHSRNIGQVSKF